MTQRRRTTLPPLVAVVGVIAILYIGRDVFLPLAIAILLTFALAPLVGLLRRAGAPRIVAVIASAVLAFSLIGLFSMVVAIQIGDLAQNIPQYQSNILSKVRTLREAGASSGIVDRLSGIIERVGREMETPEPGAQGAPEPEPLPVEVISRTRPIEVLENLILPLVSPLATTGLIIVVVIFMLLEREDLRDRFIRLVGYGDLHRTTEALQEAGRRVGQYLLMQLIVNVTYAVPVTIGLWLLGIPNAPLWGLLTLVLRFVPYIGPVLGMILPLFLALAVSPGWSLLFWTGALFVAMELVSNNVIEPWLYGSRTGLSPLAIIVAAIFWTWLWGPLGLVLSTPLTVCLSVLGRHVPQFEFLDVLFGSEPVLDPTARLYQRLLAGDPDEATEQAEEALETDYLATFYAETGIPALMLAEEDRARGALSESQRQLVAGSALTMVDNLEAIAEAEAAEEEEDVANKAGETEAVSGEAEKAGDGEAPAVSLPDLPDGAGRSVIAIGGRGDLDDAAAAMLAQVVAVQGAHSRRAGFSDLKPVNLRALDLAGVETVVIGFLNPQSLRHAHFTVRRIRRVAPAVRVGVVIWSGREPEAASPADELGADFVAHDLAGAVRGALSDTATSPYVARRLVRRIPLAAAARIEDGAGTD
jgi:predicted PurR-regulated permease PerM